MEDAPEKKLNPIQALLDGVRGKKGMRQARRALIFESFTRAYAHKPMSSHDVGQGREWRAWLKNWIARKHESRATVYRDPDKAARKASAFMRWKARKMERAKRRKLARQAFAAITRGAP